MRIILAIGIIAIIILVPFIYKVLTEKTVKPIDLNNTKEAYFAGGCFWCMEYSFEKVYGVKEVISGYSGGEKENPTYEEVSTGKTGHKETIKVLYNPEEITYKQLIWNFLKNIDPINSKGQFNDIGPQYQTAIFYLDENQKEIAQNTIEKLKELKIYENPITIQIEKYKKFYNAEEYHQDYHKKNTIKFNLYKIASGREKFSEEKWKNIYCKECFVRPNDETLKNQLSEMSYKVTRQNETEPPFNNEYYNNKKEGIYVDIISGEPLFSSKNKFESGTGWPSFDKPISEESLEENKDASLGMTRIEIRAKQSGSHLGHLFYNGPTATEKRYCINSASLKFIPKEKMEELGYGDFLNN